MTRLRPPGRPDRSRKRSDRTSDLADSARPPSIRARVARWWRGARSRFRVYRALHPGRIAAGGVGLVLLLGVGVLAVDRHFSISCAADVPCVTIDQLAAGEGLPEAIRIHDRNGALFAEVAGPRRHALTHDEIPALLAEAFVLVEDRRFREHEGVDTRGVARALLRNVVAADISEGASTIPMQLVRTIWAESLRDVGPWRRKVIEARTAPELIARLGHDQVLTLYLNAIYLGNGTYGVDRAARHYFGVPAGELDTGEIATLVGMTRSPEYYDPRRHPDRARQVRNVVLELMYSNGLVREDVLTAIRDTPVEVSDENPADIGLGERSHVTAAVTRELRRVAPELAGRPGLEIHTTIDPVVQEAGKAAIADQLAAIEGGQYGAWTERDSMAPLEGAAVAIDPRSGAVLAWVGGRDFRRSEFDRVDQARRQVGSLIKPLLVASALEHGVGIVDLVSAERSPIPTAEGSWIPADHVAETSLPLREALIRSSNRAAAHLGMNVGLAQLSEIGRRAGIESPIPELPSTSIGAFDASLLEMTTAFAVFGNGGTAVTPHLITSVEGPGGELLWSRPEDDGPVRVLSEAHAFVVLDAMRAVVQYGTGVAAGARYRGPAAGKTGTTNDGRDAWFVGLTPDLVAGVWFGFDQPEAIVGDAGGGTLSAPAWGSWMEAVRRSGRPRSGGWVPPAGVQLVRYETATGDVLSLTCRGDQLEGSREAWVQSGIYTPRSCTEGVGGWLGRLWKRVSPGG